jgi:hypothetical protein
MTTPARLNMVAARPVDRPSSILRATAPVADPPESSTRHAPQSRVASCARRRPCRLRFEHGHTGREDGT